MPILSNFPCGGGTGGIGLPLSPATNIETLFSSGKVYIKWTDPNDLVVDNSTLATWAGTVLVRKAGSAPISRRDGVIVLDSKTRNAYENDYFCDSGLTDGVTYYYKLFPYSSKGTYTNNDDAFDVTPNPVLLGNVTGITTAEAGNGKMSIKWTDPAAAVVSDGVTLATWASTIVVVKEGSYATSPNDPDAVFTYTSTTRNGHTTNPAVVTGLTNGTTYYVSLFPMSTDGAANTNAANRKTGVANRIVISSTPSQNNTLTYNANSQFPSWSNYNSTQLALGGDTSGINAGSYNATFTPNDDYMWADGTTVAKTVSWSIGKASITVPTTSSSFTYDGNKKSPTWSGYDSAKMTIGGTYSTTNAGTYTATFTPTANYKWSDGTTAAKSVSWSIAKAAGSLSLSATSVTLNVSNLTKAVTVTRAGDGAITATSSNTSVATVSVSGTTVTIKHVNQTSGSATITVKVAAGTNHNAPANKTVAVTAQFVSSTLNDNSWAVISDVSAKGQGANYWSVGDRKAVAIQGTIGTLAVNTTLYVYILGFNHNSAKEGSGIQFGTFKTALSGGTDVCLVDSYYGQRKSDGTKTFNMNHGYVSTNGNGGWKACDMRYDILGSTNKAPSNYKVLKVESSVGYDAPANTATSPVADTLMAALPSDLRAVMKPITKYTDNVGKNGSSADYITSSIDYLPLLAEFELFGKIGKAGQYESMYQLQYDYYKTGNSKLKFKHSNLEEYVVFWERSAGFYAGNFGSANSSGYGSVEYTGEGSSDFSQGIAPVFMV